jgi:Protein of unknown function (DUF1064)
MTSAAWRTIGGKTKYFRSVYEANYARYLEFLKINLHILDWSYEPKTFWFEGIRRGCVSYKPDFCVWEKDNSASWHEVKGYYDAKSKTKVKRFAKYFPKNKLIFIDSKWFKANGKKLSGLIGGWEKGSSTKKGIYSKKVL